MEEFNDLKLSELKGTDVLFFIRIRGQKSFFKNFYTDGILKLFPNIEDHETISEYPNANIYINLNKVKLHNFTYSDYEIINKVIDFPEISHRERVFRRSSLLDSKRQILLCAKFFIDLFSNSKPKLMVIPVVDNYVLDILVRVAGHYNIPVMGVCNFFIKGYKRLTVYGERNIVRTPSIDEVQGVLNDLLAVKPSFMANNRKRAVLNYLYNLLSYSYRFVSRYLIGYKMLGKLSYEHKYVNKFTSSPFKNFAFGVFDNVNLEHIDRTKSIYMPLHWHPEATVDYWVADYNDSDYISSLLQVIAFFEEINVQVIIKEHPACYLQRSREFYKLLKSYANVKILQPYVLTQDVIKYIDNVVVWTGTSGIEMAMNDKNVFIVTENYYSDLFDLPHYKEFESYDRPIFTLEQKNQAVKKLLSSTVIVSK